MWERCGPCALDYFALRSAVDWNPGRRAGSVPTPSGAYSPGGPSGGTGRAHIHGLGVMRQSADTSQNAVSIDLASASDAAQEIRDEVSATYGGALAEERLPRERGLVLWPGRWNFWNDGSIAAGIIRTMVENGSSGEADPRIARLESRSESLVVPKRLAPKP